MTGCEKIRKKKYLKKPKEGKHKKERKGKIRRKKIEWKKEFREHLNQLCNNFVKYVAMIHKEQKD